MIIILDPKLMSAQAAQRRRVLLEILSVTNHHPGALRQEGAPEPGDDRVRAALSKCEAFLEDEANLDVVWALVTLFGTATVGHLSGLLRNSGCIHVQTAISLVLSVWAMGAPHRPRPTEVV